MFFFSKGTEVISDKDLSKLCNFSAVNKTSNAEANIKGDTCFVIVKGSKYSKTHADLEERIVRANPKIKIATIDAVKKRLSFEDPQSLSADMFAMKVHALRNATHYMSMVNPLTWDYISTFMSQAISSPTYSYTGDYKSPVKVIKTGSSAFKSRNTPPVSAPTSQPSIRKQKQPSPDLEKKTSGGSKTGGEKKEGEKKEEVPETVAERFAREKRRRDEMDRQSRESLFEDGDTQTEGDAEEVAEEEEEENIIEL